MAVAAPLQRERRAEGVVIGVGEHLGLPVAQLVAPDHRPHVAEVVRELVLVGI